jgi:hypothetical protein
LPADCRSPSGFSPIYGRAACWSTPGPEPQTASLETHILVAPPFIIEDAEIDWLARQIGEAVTEVL